MPSDPPTTVQARFKCNSGDGATLCVDAPPPHSGGVTISVSQPSSRITAWIIASPETARQIAAAILRCADEAETVSNAE